MLGKPGRTKPVFCMNVAGPCTFDFATIEWMNAMSSTQDARWGTRPLTHLPHWPCCFQSQGLAITAPGLLWKQLDFAAGIELLAVALDQLRLVVEGVALAGGAGHEELHDALGFRRMMQANGCIGEQSRFAQQLGEGDSAETAAVLPEKISAVHSFT